MEENPSPREICGMEINFQTVKIENLLHRKKEKAVFPAVKRKCIWYAN